MSNSDRNNSPNNSTETPRQTILFINNNLPANPSPTTGLQSPQSLSPEPVSPQTEPPFGLHCPFHHDIHQRCAANARKRWRILARVLRRNSLEGISSSSDASLSSIQTNSTNSSQQSSLDSVDSLRSFDGFDIVQHMIVPFYTRDQLLGADENWYQYRMKVKEHYFEVNVHHINKLWTARDLIGFNNTGNVCVWPSEEALTYYILEHITEFRDQWILELGGGMTCLAGLMISKYGAPFLVHLTDGNGLSVENVKRSLRLNDFECFTKTSVLKWECTTRRHPAEKYRYDLILSADCLFFDESRESLVNAIDFYLSPKNGRAFIMAPRRGHTLESFLSLATSKGFNHKLVERYSESIWLKHHELKQTSLDYNEDIHYPLLIILEKKLST